MSSWLLSTSSSKSLLLLRAQRSRVFQVGGSGLSMPSRNLPLNSAQACAQESVRGGRALCGQAQTAENCCSKSLRAEILKKALAFRHTYFEFSWRRKPSFKERAGENAAECTQIKAPSFNFFKMGTLFVTFNGNFV